MLPLERYLVTVFFLFILFPATAQTGTIRGNIFDQVSKDPLPAANITLQSTTTHTQADEKGNFMLTEIRPGEYDLLITIVGYTNLYKHVVVRAGEITKVYLGLTSGASALEEVTVFGKADREKETGARDRERTAANMMNVISSQAMVRSPDINAANVLQRMSGVTIQRSSGGDEAYAIIRGMEPRYSNTLLNGIKIASPDSKNRYVNLGIIPSDILSSIETSKSLTPDMEGDATGGTVNLVVKDAPDRTSFKATASIGYSQLFFDEKYYTFKKSAIQGESPAQRNPPGYKAQSGDFSRSNLDFQPQQAPPTALAGFSFTHRYFHDRLGVVLADNLQNQYYGNISSQASVSPGNDTTGRLYATDANNFKQYTQQLNNGLVAHLDYVINEKNKVDIDNFYLYSYMAQSRFNVDTTLVGTGRTLPGTGQVFLNDVSQTQHQHVENLKVSGYHTLTPRLRLDWSGVLSEAGSSQPDAADITNVFLINSDFSHTATFFDGISRNWQKNNDKEYSGILNLDYHIKWKENDLGLKAGGLYRYASRINTEDDYNLVPPSTNSSGGAAGKPVWDNIYDAQWQVFNPTGNGIYNPNDYTATETIYDGYGMVRYKSGNQWDLGGGLRVEHTDDEWNIHVHSQSAPSYGGQIYQEFLPSAFIKRWFSPHSNLHLSYYRSLARPNYYELVPAEGPIDLNSGSRVEGNPFVKHSMADNFDIRYELFPKGEEHLFIGAFYKHITNPIEVRLLDNGGGVYRVEPLNSNPATNFGAEASFTQYWGRFGITGNYTYTHSKISSAELSPQGDTVYPVRPMQGQSVHIGNLSLLYKDTRHGAFAQISYQYQGTTLAETGKYAGADFYQRPMNTLAVSGEKDIHKHFTVFGKFNNLLNTPEEQYVQNRVLVLKNIYRATYTVGVRYAY